MQVFGTAFGQARIEGVMRIVLLVFASVAFLFGVTGAQALVQVNVDLASQSMHVESSQGTYDWPISSARSGYFTPDGTFAPTRLELMHYSKKYHMSPMPHAIFFAGGFAIHGTYETRSLGRPASHGCVRISPANAARLYAMVEAEGARISIFGSPPSSRPFYAGGHHHRHLAGTGSPMHASTISAPAVSGFGFTSASDMTSPLLQ